MIACAKVAVVATSTTLSAVVFVVVVVSDFKWAFVSTTVTFCVVIDSMCPKASKLILSITLKALLPSALCVIAAPVPSFS